MLFSLLLGAQTISGPVTLSGPVGINGPQTQLWNIQNGWTFSTEAACWNTGAYSDSGGIGSLTMVHLVSPASCAINDNSGVMGSGNLNYTSGELQSSVSFLYGKFEARVQFSGAETHPAFWLTNTSRACCWSTGGLWYYQWQEIDIAELVPTDAANTLRQNVLSTGTTHADTTTVTNMTSSFHTYTATWDAYGVTFFVDGTQTNYIAQTGFTEPETMILSVESDTGTPNPAHYPQAMQIDYAKHWPLNGNGTCCAATPDFDAEF